MADDPGKWFVLAIVLQVCGVLLLAAIVGAAMVWAIAKTF